MAHDDAIKENSDFAKDCRTFVCPLVSGGPSDLEPHLGHLPRDPPKGPREAPKRPPRGPQEAPKRPLRGPLGGREGGGNLAVLASPIECPGPGSRASAGCAKL